MRIAHFSDLHVLALDGVAWTRYLNKRVTGVANLALRRAPVEELTGLWRKAAERFPARLKKKDVHRRAYVRAVAREIARSGVDHVVVTGDLTNLALEAEFAAAREILEGELHLAARDVSVVPGNHDTYTRGALRARRFTEFFADYTKCDIDVAVDIGPGRFPYVKLRGPCAVIGLSSAVPRAPFLAAGEVGERQLAALRVALAHPEVARRTPVVLVHHPPRGPRSAVKRMLEGLRDGPRLVAALDGLRRGLVLHGHLHTRMQSRLPTSNGEIVIAGAASASLHHEHAARMSGFNVYTFDEGGELTSIDARVFDPKSDAFQHGTVPEGMWV